MADNGEKTSAEMKEDEKEKERIDGQTRGQKIAKTRPTPADRGGMACNVQK
jgi:hypothetical protein